ncbi:hypothetical protein DPMN_111487 [Dreissena polymorpha]|uniref:Uncharacterized protein n=1 Tax=Dreissena polymorpha TaxID=45954 RepID=A0A9D4QNV5_DREPO|nr:hypothetical protein DPMN_111487 [Dreissena polymorpha]
MDFKSAHSSTRLRSSRTPSHAQQFAPGLPPWGGPAPDRTSHKPMGFIPPHMPMFPPQHGVFHPAWGSSQVGARTV